MRLMRRVVGSAIVMAVAAGSVLGGLAGCTQQRAAEAPVPLTNLPNLDQAGLKMVWERRLPLEPGERLEKSWRVNNSVYISSSDARLFRVDAKSGVLAWAVGLGAENFHIYRPIELPKTRETPDGRVLVVARGEGFVLDITTGDVKQQEGLGISVTCDPTVIENTLAVGCTGRFLGLYLDRLGGKRWTVAEAGQLFVSTPATIEGDIVLATQSGLLRRIDAETGSWKWKDRKTNGEVTAGLAIDNRAVYIPCLDQRVYAFTSDAGSELWEQQIEGVLDQTPVIAGSTLLVPSGGRGLYALAKQTGDRKWMAPGVTTVGTIVRDHVWVADDAGNLKSLSLDTGEVLSSTPVPAAQMVVRNAVDEEVILINRSGMVGGFITK